MLILGIETSCDETGVALYDSRSGLLCDRLHSQSAMHAQYGGVVPELASRDHIRRLLPLVDQVLSESGRKMQDVDAIAHTEGPGLAGALLVGAAVATGLGYAVQRPVLGIHHLEAHLLSPLLAQPAPVFPFVALLVSGGHTQLMAVEEVGRYRLLGESADDAAGEAFDKAAKLLELPYPGGPALAKLAESGNPHRFKLPRPMLNSADLNFSFSGLKTAVSLLTRDAELVRRAKADIAASFQEAIVDVLSAKCQRAMSATGLNCLVVAGGVGANLRLRQRLDELAGGRGARVFYPPLRLCTDNGAMIAFAAALRLERYPTSAGSRGFTVRPRWDLDSLPATA
jgi:N6-L-threonylcarbamoyladenine synthase